MAHGSDSSDSSYGKTPSPASSRQGSSDNIKKVMRREKNRIAAQKSRMRQTQKADSLHLCGPFTGPDELCVFVADDGLLLPEVEEAKQESENLEKENAALRKEVKRLTEEAKYLSSVLTTHEPLCSGLAPQTTHDLLYSPHHHGSSAFHHSIAVSHYQH